MQDIVGYDSKAGGFCRVELKAKAFLRLLERTEKAIAANKRGLYAQTLGSMLENYVPLWHLIAADPALVAGWSIASIAEQTTDVRFIISTTDPGWFKSNWSEENF